MTSHPAVYAAIALPITWGAENAIARGPIIGTLTTPAHRNCIGIHAGSYSVYRALAVACGALDPLHKPDLTNTAPTWQFGLFDSLCDPTKIVSLDPWGADIGTEFADYIKAGYNIQPTIAVTRAHIHIPELLQAVHAGTLQIDGEIIVGAGECKVTKAAVEPVWYLPGVAARFGINESDLRRGLFEYTGGMFPELVTRSDLNVLLPPIGGQTVYIFGDPSTIPDRSIELTV